MSVRKTRAAVGALATAALALSVVGTAHADPADPSVIQANDYVAVGSDTTQYLVSALANAWNTQGTAPANKAYSFDACTTPTPNTATSFPCTPGGTITPRPNAVSGPTSGTDFTRPANSGDGRKALMGTLQASHNGDAYTFSRASGLQDAAADTAGLRSVPFALDTLVVAVAKNSPAPTTITGEEVLGIYDGTYTNWKQIGGADAPIHPLLPKSGSGTRDFFATPAKKSQLFLLNGSVEPTLVFSDKYSGGTKDVQEHDPSALIADPNAIEPFSLGRAGFATSSIRALGGWSADRDVYNVLRKTQIAGGTIPTANVDSNWLVDSTPMQDLFGPTGFICSSAQAGTIQAQGFYQLTTDCGNQFTSSGSPSKAARGRGAYTTTSAAVSGKTVTVTVAPKSGSGAAPTGNVTISLVQHSKTGVASPFKTTVALSGGKATATIPDTVPAGTYEVDAAYAGQFTGSGYPQDTTFTYVGSSNSDAGATAPTYTAVAKTVVAKTISVPTKVIKVKKGKAIVKVTITGITAPTTLVIKSGAKVIAKVVVTKDGVVTIKIKAKKLKAGVKKYKVVLAGWPTKTIKIKK